MEENDQADRVAGKATITNGLHLRRSEVLRSLKHNLQAQIQGHCTINCMEEMHEKRKCLMIFLGREEKWPSSIKYYNCFNAMSRKLLKDGKEHVGFFKCTDTILNCT